MKTEPSTNGARAPTCPIRSSKPKPCATALGEAQHRLGGC